MIHWPMNVLTRSTGDSRVLKVKPKKCIDRSFINPDGGLYKITNENKIKIPNGEYYCEIKAGGHFHVYSRDGEGNYSMYGRRLNVNGQYIDIYPKLKTTPLPELPLGTAVALELVWPGYPDSSVPTAIKECPEELSALAFGLAIYKGESYVGTEEPYSQARKKLVQLFGGTGVIPCTGTLYLDRRNKCGTLESLLTGAYRHAIEGYVLKRFAYDGWWKIKGMQEADVFITGFKVSKSDTYYGQVTAVEVGVYDDEGNVIPMGRVSGFKDPDKYSMTEDPNTYLFRPIRVLYQERASKGLLKHGSFESWRDDKTAKECIYAEQFHD